jgi:dethiobiotin synthetase
MSCIIAGTDTDVGKTVASAVLAKALARRGDVGYWKPIASGARDGRDVDVVARLAGVPCAAESYLLEEPLSPHLAARLAGVAIELDTLEQAWQDLRRGHPGRRWLVEGAGGLLVPLDDAGTLQVDFFARLALPVVLVARSGLGTINHSLLSLEALHRRGLDVAGIVLVGSPNTENRRAIETLGQVATVAEIPWLDPLDPASVAAVAEGIDLPDFAT